MSETHIRYVPHSGQAVCYHCGDSYQITPCSIGIAEVVLKQWAREHKQCQEDERGIELKVSTVAQIAALPLDAKSSVGLLTLRDNATLGEKVAHNLLVAELKKSKSEKGDDVSV